MLSDPDGLLQDPQPTTPRSPPFSFPKPIPGSLRKEEEKRKKKGRHYCTHAQISERKNMSGVVHGAFATNSVLLTSGEQRIRVPRIPRTHARMQIRRVLKPTRVHPQQEYIAPSSPRLLSEVDPFRKTLSAEKSELGALPRKKVRFPIYPIPFLSIISGSPTSRVAQYGLHLYPHTYIHTYSTTTPKETPQ